MKAHDGTHPTAEVLLALGTGKLDDAAVEPVLAHLETCHDCQTRLSSLSGDSMLARLRAVHGAVSTRAATAAPAALDVLPELRNHPQYEVLRELGRGGMGVVYLAKNKLMERDEVLKVVNKQLLGQDGAAERFLREIRSAARLNHRNIVTAYTTLQVGDLLIFAMEYVVGDDLAKVVKDRGPLPVANACFYIREAAMGLQHASERRMIHRDIKPGNLMLAREGKKHIVKILDFGLAKATREGGTTHDLTGDNKMLGTPDYIAPEQALDATRVDIRADIYSLGCSLHYLLTGKAPFKAKSLYELLQAHISMNATPVHELRPEVPAELSAVIAKMMAKDPAQRYQTPAEVAKALAPFMKAGVKALPAERAGAIPDPWTTVSAAAAPSTASRTDTVSRTERQETIVEQPAPLVQMSPHVAALGPSGRLRRRKLLIGAGIGVGVLLIMVLGVALIAPGVFMLRTKDGTIVLEDLPSDAVVTVNGKKVTLELKGDGKAIQIRVVPGKHTLEIQRDGFKIQTAKVMLAAGERKPVHVRLEPNPTAAPDEIINTIGMKLKRIKPGTFTMGSPKQEEGRLDNEGPQHEVEIT
jgi:serine/threonine protein kinase